MKVLVCGDRNWEDKESIKLVLEKFPGDMIIIHGACWGADRMAAEVAESLGLRTKAFPADWARYGRGAGPIRNRKMLDESPDIVLAFHNDLSQSRGTRDTVMEATNRGIKTRIIRGAIV